MTALRQPTATRVSDFSTLSLAHKLAWADKKLAELASERAEIKLRPYTSQREFALRHATLLGIAKEVASLHAKQAAWREAARPFDWREPQW